MTIATAAAACLPGVPNGRVPFKQQKAETMLHDMLRYKRGDKYLSKVTISDITDAKGAELEELRMTFKAEVCFSPSHMPCLFVTTLCHAIRNWQWWSWLPILALWS